MDDVTYAPLAREHAARLAAWTTRGADDMLFKLPDMPAGAGAGDSWVATVHGEPIAVASLTPDDHRIFYLNLLVKPSERRQGVGTGLLHYILALPEVQRLGRIRAVVGLDNLAAQRTLSRAGFSRIGYSPDGRLEYERH